MGTQRAMNKNISDTEVLLTGETIYLRPATLAEKNKVFHWLAHSNLTSEMLGPPTFPDNPVPSWEEFDSDYVDYFFDGTRPLKGRSFIIIHNNREIGHINYNDIDPETLSTELDIWLADKQFTGRRFGSEALELLCNYLCAVFGCKTIYIQPSQRNPHAIRAYKKAGFVEQRTIPNNMALDYEDSLLLEKSMDTTTTHGHSD